MQEYILPVFDVCMNRCAETTHLQGILERKRYFVKESAKKAPHFAKCYFDLDCILDKQN